MTQPPEPPVHACPPDGSTECPCCGLTPFDLPREDGITLDPGQVTCHGSISPADDPQVREWLDHAQLEVLPMIERSSMLVQVGTGSDPDAKAAVELGFALLLDKPLIILRMPDMVVPSRLARAADAVVDWTEDLTTLSGRIRTAIDGLGLDAS